MLHEPVPPPDPFATQHRNWAQWFGSDWHAVRIATAAQAQAAMEQWGLSDAEPFGSGGAGHLYRARLRTGETVVLKVEPATGSWTPQAADRALVVWGRAGLAARVIATRDDGRTMLLELVTPGTQLGGYTASPDEFVRGRRRHGAQAPISRPHDGGRPVSDDRRARRGGGLAAGPGVSSPRDRGRARCPARAARDDADPKDLYQDNILRARNGWVVIDPKPVLADPHAECFALLAAAEYVTGPAILERYARVAGLPDPRLLARWVRIRALITTAQRSESAEPTSDSARWDAHVHALARMLEPPGRHCRRPGA